MQSTGIRYLQPKDMDELLSALAGMTEKDVILGGGTDLLPEMRKKPWDAKICLSLSHMEELKRIEREGDWLKIGAMATHTKISGDKVIKHYFNALAMACEKVGSTQIRNKGTIGGSLVNSTPAGDMMPCAFLLEAELEICNHKREMRRIKAIDFLDERGQSQIACDEVLMWIWLPIKPEQKSCFIKLGTRREVSIAQISLCLSWKEVEGECQAIRVFMGAVDSKPIELSEGKSLEGQLPISDEKAGIFSQAARCRITCIRENSKRESKLRLNESEKLYKERSVKGLVYDIVEYMNQG